MSRYAHHQALERIYLEAPVNRLYLPTIQVTDTGTTITIEASDKFHHAAGAAHESIYLKMMEDAAYFAASAVEREIFIYTLSFQTYMLRPLVKGQIRSFGRLTKRTRTHYFADAVLTDATGDEIGRGSGVFVRSRRSLLDGSGDCLVPQEETGVSS